MIMKTELPKGQKREWKKLIVTSLIILVSVVAKLASHDIAHWMIQTFGH